MEQGLLAFDSSINTIRMSRLWEDGKILRVKNLGANRVTIVTRFSRSAECRCTVNDVSSIADLMNANISTLTPAPLQVTAFEEISIEFDGMVADTTYTVTCAQAESVDISLRLYTPYSLLTEQDNIIVSALKVSRIDVDSVTLSIAFSTTNFARCILFNKDVAANVITTTNKVFFTTNVFSDFDAIGLHTPQPVAARALGGIEFNVTFTGLTAATTYFAYCAQNTFPESSPADLLSKRVTFTTPTNKTMILDLSVMFVTSKTVRLKSIFPVTGTTRV